MQITKQTSQGTAVIDIRYGCASLTLDGKAKCTDGMLHRFSKPVEKNGEVFVAQICGVGLTQLEADQVKVGLVTDEAPSTPAELAYKPVSLAWYRASSTKTADHDYAESLRLRAVAQDLENKWAEQFPTAAAARRGNDRKEDASAVVEIRSRPGYLNALEGRD